MSRVEATTAESWERRLFGGAVVVGGLALGVVAYQVQLENLPATTAARSAAVVASGWAFLAAGLVVRARRPGNGLGALMLLAGFAFLARQLRYDHDPLAFTTFFLLGELPYALFAHTALAYPTGRVTDRLERGFLWVTYAVVTLLPLAILLAYDGTHSLRYFDREPRESLLYLAGDEGLVRALQGVYAVSAYGVLAAVFVALIARKLLLATPRARRLLAPLLLAAFAAAIRAIFDSVLTFASRPPAVVYDNLFWWQIVAVTALPLALLAGLLRARLARGSVASLVVELERTPPDGIRDALARALDDPTVELALWLPERGWTDLQGRPLPLPEDGPARAVTRFDRHGRPLAALVHDPSLREEPQLVEAAGAAARLALENARLHAEVQAQLAKVKESRARLVAAGDEQRRRIERDLHDGAQQQLVALALELRRAKRDLPSGAGADVERLLDSTADELQVAVQQLRELAAGIHPSVLTQGGLAAALNALAARAPLPVSVEAPAGRLPEDAEVTAYYVAAEALTNVAKHAGASQASVTARLEEGRLVVVVADDGVGGAAANGGGSGLRGLADRVEAVGGRLVVESPPGGGTRVTGEIPCAS